MFSVNATQIANLGNYTSQLIKGINEGNYRAAWFVEGMILSEQTCAQWWALIVMERATSYSELHPDEINMLIKTVERATDEACAEMLADCWRPILANLSAALIVAQEREDERENPYHEWDGSAAAFDRAVRRRHVYGG